MSGRIDDATLHRATEGQQPFNETANDVYAQLQSSYWDRAGNTSERFEWRGGSRATTRNTRNRSLSDYIHQEANG